MTDDGTLYTTAQFRDIRTATTNAIPTRYTDAGIVRARAITLHLNAKRTTLDDTATVREDARTQPRTLSRAGDRPHRRMISLTRVAKGDMQSSDALTETPASEPISPVSKPSTSSGTMTVPRRSSAHGPTRDREVELRRLLGQLWTNSSQRMHSCSNIAHSKRPRVDRLGRRSS
ncbi:hypothetical protein C8039_12050 [Halogeometricum sp. wsp3]|nr:hypothetical protein C8039_12050 [Halogeometricum sp. wsp3]